MARAAPAGDAFAVVRKRMQSMTTYPQNNRVSRTPRRSFAASTRRFTGSIEDLVATLKPQHPLYVLRPEDLARTAREFTDLFPGDVMYATKCNPEKIVLQTLYKSGVKSFDVASIEETRLAAQAAPKAKLYFMHPVKSPEAIREAYEVHGVRAFVLDTQEELYKILQQTNFASDLELFVRMSAPKNGDASIDFSSKFGAAPDDTALLLQQCRPVAVRLGLCFHVGTQTISPAPYVLAINMAATVIGKSGVKIDFLDIGGGFPATYPGQTTPSPLPQFMKSIVNALKKCGLSKIPLLAEPGRALVANSTTLVVRVEQRRDDLLYINDGTYGGLFDAGPTLNQRFPVRLIRWEGVQHPQTLPFRMTGPTCDALDMMAGPFELSTDIKTGDWIEIGNAGAYSRGLRGNFNGFGESKMVALYERSSADVSA